MKNRLISLLGAGICVLGISGGLKSDEPVRRDSFMMPTLTMEVMGEDKGDYMKFYDAGADGLDKVVKGDGEVVLEGDSDFWIYETAYRRKILDVLNKRNGNDSIRMGLRYFGRNGKNVIYDSFADGYVSWILDEKGDILEIKEDERRGYQRFYENMLRQSFLDGEDFEVRSPGKEQYA